MDVFGCFGEEPPALQPGLHLQGEILKVERTRDPRVFHQVGDSLEGKVHAISVVRCSLSTAIMDRREVLVWALAWTIINAVVLVMIPLSLATLSISAFLLVRYRRGDEPPDSILPMACWYILGTSLGSLLCWTVAPFVRVLRKIRWLLWIVMFGLWFGAAFLAYTGMGWTTEDNDSYCKMPYDEKPFGFGAWGERRRRRVRRMDVEERVVVEPEPVPLLQNTLIPHPPIDAGPPEGEVKAPEGAGCIPGPPEPVHVSKHPGSGVAWNSMRFLDKSMNKRGSKRFSKPGQGQMHEAYFDNGNGNEKEGKRTPQEVCSTASNALLCPLKWYGELHEYSSSFSVSRIEEYAHIRQFSYPCWPSSSNGIDKATKFQLLVHLGNEEPSWCIERERTTRMRIDIVRQPCSFGTSLKYAVAARPMTRGHFQMRGRRWVRQMDLEPPNIKAQPPAYSRLALDLLTATNQALAASTSADGVISSEVLLTVCKGLPSWSGLQPTFCQRENWCCDTSIFVRVTTADSEISIDYTIGLGPVCLGLGMKRETHY
ncbi:hypothetical protein BKA70DRAFT_1239605 [Coprinopsis sp. MPI-PUGE-AT-0042]|nr:hypothetical protein BKA70DRAFT_1239605 [Coprinopsis sp. MPI-PUGE-AT-0042]